VELCWSHELLRRPLAVSRNDKKEKKRKEQEKV